MMSNTPSVSKTRRILPYVVLTFALLGAGTYALDERMRPILVAGPMVQIPDSSGIVIVWHAEPRTSKGFVSWRTMSGETGKTAASVLEGRHEARIAGLERGAKLEYRVFNEGLLGRNVGMSGPHEASMPFRRDESFRFIAFGDSGSGSNSQASLADLMARQKPDVAIHVGDLIYPAGAAEDYLLKFFEPNAALIRRAAFMPCLGNHDIATDSGQPLLDVFVLPENGPKGIQAERDYYFDFGDARFVALDSNLTDSDGAMSIDQLESSVAPWLRNVLTDCDATWRFVYFHHPFYTGSAHSPEGAAHMKSAFAQTFEECGVDLVFCGHNHLYERTAPIRGDAVVPEGEGIVYIVTGAGGKNRYPESENPPAYIRAFNDEVFSFTVVDVSEERLELRQIDEQGRAIDAYGLTKAKRSQQAI